MHLEEIRALEKRYVMQTYGRNEIALVSGEGARLRDSEGKEYIDLTSGIGVSCLGYHHPALSAAISDQRRSSCTVRTCSTASRWRRWQSIW